MNIKLDQQDENSFLVALIPSLPIPEGKTPIEGLEDFAVIACNESEKEPDHWGYVCLTKEEKKLIGDTLILANKPINVWIWCNLYLDSEESNERN